MVRLMKQTKLNSLNRLRRTTNNGHRGIVLPVVIVVGMILMVGGMSQMSRSFAYLITAKRQEENETAKAVAGSGMAIILKTLNLEYPYLLTTDCEPIIHPNAPDDQNGIPSCEEWHGVPPFSWTGLKGST